MYPYFQWSNRTFAESVNAFDNRCFWPKNKKCVWNIFCQYRVMRSAILIFCLIPFLSSADWPTRPLYGFNVSVVVNVGTHVNRIGFSLNAYYTDYFYQFNIGNTSTFNLTSYGKRKKFLESRSALGFLLLGGKRNNEIDLQLDGLLHNTRYQNGFGYNYLWKN